MKKDIALFFDIDGTLRNPKTGKISQAVFDEISIWQKEGYPCCISTGRCIENAMHQGIEVHHWDGIIGTNGQQVQGPNGEMIIDGYMNEEMVEKAISTAKKLGQSLYLIAGNEWIRVGEINDDVIEAQALFGGDLPDEKPWKDKKIIYFIAFAKDIHDYEEYEKVGFKTAPTFYHYADVVLPGYDKAKGIKTYMEHEGIHQYYAFGDSTNDLEMIQQADLGVVMQNGDPTMFQYADIIAPSVEEDGIVKVLQDLRAKW